MQHCRFQLADVELLVVVQELIERVVQLGLGNTVLLSEQALHPTDPLSNAYGRPEVLVLFQGALQVRGGRQMVCVRMCLEDPHDLETFGPYQGSEAVGGASADRVRCHIMIQDWVDDNSIQALRIGDDVLPCTGSRIMYAVHGDCRRHGLGVYTLWCVAEGLSRDSSA